jgi:hypothetical protein
MLGDIDLIFDMRVYNHKLLINFEIHSGWMIFGQLTAVGLWNLAKYLVVTFHSDTITLSWIWAKQSLLLLLNASCLVEKNKYQFYSLWFKILFSHGGHLEYHTDFKNSNMFDDDIRNIPSKFPFKWLNGFKPDFSIMFAIVSNV